MREIKFKIWDTAENRFLELKDYQELGAIEVENDGTLTLSPRFRFLTSMMIMPERFIPLQFTGLYDKNTVPIYEGDILYDKYIYWEVCFYDGAFWRKWLYPDVDGEKEEEYLGGMIDDLEVIGNIHDKKEE